MASSIHTIDIMLPPDHLTRIVINSDYRLNSFDTVNISIWMYNIPTALDQVDIQGPVLESIFQDTYRIVNRILPCNSFSQQA